MSESPQEPSVGGMPSREKGLSSPATCAPRSEELLRAIRMWTWVLLLTGIALTSAHALTKLPHEDEGDLASAAASLLDRGRIAFPMEYMYLPSVRQAYPLLPPFYPASVATWFAAFGRSLEAYRLYHVAWFVLLVVSWMQLVQTATVTRVALPIAAGLFALNYDLINLSVSRYDIVCAALNSAAMASFAVWRLRRFSLAMFVANCCLAIAALTHPYAIFGLIGCLSIFLRCSKQTCEAPPMPAKPQGAATWLTRNPLRAGMLAHGVFLRRPSAKTAGASVMGCLRRAALSEPICVRIDVEGAELLVLRGMRRILRDMRRPLRGTRTMSADRHE